ncbi:hypothetical protein Vadar_029840 [Vaccinium darrowii]|uniref:Uncharacterized protein n=1 Tax=Vaccinium darrowii TaxID=229202 RepID=A0ACB7Z732_9ERIC|nr:hypothetical protein Vadar_029840 [Vaccinium darrowii]
MMMMDMMDRTIASAVVNTRYFWSGIEEVDLPQDVVTALRKDLEQYWPNLRHRRDEKADSHFEFWEDEWRKHGSCFGLDPATYFRLAIQFRKRSNLLYVLGKEGIVPGRKLYLPDEIKSAIEKAWSTTPFSKEKKKKSTTPQLKCNMDLQQDPQLVETVLCIQTPTQQENYYTICSCQVNRCLSVSGSSGRTLSLFVDLHHDVRELVVLAGFEPFIETQTKTMRDHAVVTALAERWRDSTNTLHLQFGEATMTPLDFSAITGLRVGGEPLPFDAGIAHSDDALRYYLGWKPNHGADSAGYDVGLRGAETVVPGVLPGPTRDPSSSSLGSGIQRKERRAWPA